MQGPRLGCCIATYCCPCKVESGNKGAGGGRPLGPEEEEKEDSGLPSVPQAPQVKAGKRPASPQQKPTQPRKASRQDASVDLSKDSSTSRLLPESLLTIESSDDEVYTDSLTSHTTASDSTIGKINFPPGSTFIQGGMP